MKLVVGKDRDEPDEPEGAVMPGSPFQRVLSRLEGVRGTGSQRSARCPAHKDRNPSLSVGEGPDGKVLLHCNAGCTFDAICSALGMTTADLSPQDGNKKPGNRIVAQYDYHNADGKPLCRKVRFEAGARAPYGWQRPDGSWKLAGLDPGLYRLPEILKAKEAGRVIYVAEGEKDADNVAALGLDATTPPHGAGSWKPEYCEALRGAALVRILPDNDEGGRDHARAVDEALKGVANRVEIVDLPGLPEKGDVSDWIADRQREGLGTAEIVARLQALSAASEEPPKDGQAIELAQFLTIEFEPRQWLVEKLIQDRDLAMLHSHRGIGKTLVAHGLAYALASGGSFLKWQAAEPRGVLIVDGEMPREDLQKRLLQLVAGADRDELAAPFKLLSADMLDDPLPSLASEAGQRLIERELEGVSLIVLDNVSTLCASARAENEAESWEPVQKWLLSLRRRGYAVLLIHHEGVSGRQRGTSKREDVLAQVIRLAHPDGYQMSDGARFEVHFTKARGVFGKDAEPFEAQLRTDPDGRAMWTWKRVEDEVTVKIRSLYLSGMTNQRQIAEEADTSLGTVNRRVQDLRAAGDIP